MPCKTLKPKVEAFGLEVGLQVRMIDCLDEQNATLVQQEQIRTVPTVVVRRDGATVSKLVGVGQWAPEKVKAILTGLNT